METCSKITLEPVLRDIRVQTTNMCNGKCICCPHRFTYAKEPPSVMSDRTWDLILRQVDDTKSITAVSFVLHYEPFTDKDLLRKVTDIRSLGRWAVVITNGTLLTPDVIKQVADTKIDRFIVSLYSVDPKEYRHMTGGLELDRVIFTIMELMNLGRAVEINVPISASTDLSEFLKPFPDISKGKPSLMTNAIDSRAGLVPFSAKGKFSTFRQTRTYCAELFHCINVLWDGSILVCCQDWNRQSRIGHIETHHMAEIFYGRVGSDLRERFLRHDLPYPMCEVCYDEFGYRACV